MRSRERDPIDRAVDDIVAVSMAYCNAIRKHYRGRIPVLWKKLMRATRKLEIKTGRK